LRSCRHGHINATVAQHTEPFLSRLDRLVAAEVDVALGLYRDTGLVQTILASVKLPEAAERVAISLADPSDGPFLVVTRDGQFVTCLGRGMRATGLPVVTRGQLDALAARVATLRERLELAARRGGGHPRPHALLMRRILGEADAVSREDFLAVSAWEPLLAPAFLNTYLAMATEMLQQAPVLRSLRRTKGPAEEALHSYWNLAHAAGHMALLGTMGGDREHYMALTEEMPLARSAFSFALTATGAFTFIAKGAWAVGRLGKHLLPAYKKALAEDVAFFELLDTMFALVAIGRRTSGLRGEIAKALLAAEHTARTPGAIRIREALGDTVGVASKVAVEFMGADEADIERNMSKWGERLLLATEEQALPEGIPAELVRSVPLASYADGLTDGKRVVGSLTLIAAASRGPPERFYFPRELLRHWRSPWEPALTQLLLEPFRRAEWQRRVPASRAATPGPNAPCPCGSGRKYKKCCGAVAPS
jgi:hypothetical protein